MKTRWQISAYNGQVNSHTVTVVTHWWSRVAHLVHQGRHTQSCWSWQSRGECSRHYWPHRGWYLQKRRGNIHNRHQTVWGVYSTAFLPLVWFIRRHVRTMTFQFHLHRVTTLRRWKMKFADPLKRILMPFATNWNATKTNYQRLLKVKCFFDLSINIKDTQTNPSGWANWS